ncbi:MAG: acyltransferase [Roseburia sp.]|nr:acyltransferase [Roseburia sp.]MCM1099447.1 acyltransferase [Ruminococcus flavefaciens]
MTEKKRMANYELLRCVAMMMVIVLHYLGKGELLPKLTEESLGARGTVAWLLEAFCIVAVNLYMFISGYFLCLSDYKPSRLLRLLGQIWVYSMALGLLGALTGVVAETPVDTHYFLTLLFPVAMGHYWFMTAYVFLYLLLPFVGLAVKRMTKSQLGLAAGGLLAAFCLLKSVLPVRLETDGKGYDCLWYLCVFVAAAYVRRFGLPFLEKKGRGLFLYTGGSLLIFGGTMLLRLFCLRTGRLERMVGVCMEYNHILPFLAALGLFGAFGRLKVNDKIAPVINKIGPLTLGIYLLHENLGLRYSWQKWLGAEAVKAAGAGVVGVAALLAWVALAVSCVFLCGVLTELVRARAARGLGRILSRVRCWRKLTGRLAHWDEAFAEDV